MFKPNYALTAKLLSNITQIERLYGQLEALHLPQKLELNLERDNLVQSSFISNSIEGNPLSLPEVTNLLLGDRVPVNRDEKEVKNYFEILKELIDRVGKEISLFTVRELHQRLLTGVNEQIAGKIRNHKVVVGRYIKKQGKTALRVKHEPPFHLRSQIEKKLQELLDWLKRAKEVPVVLRVGIFHHEFVYIHPFEDGNGRVCRLLTVLNFLKNNYQINRYFVLDDYYDIDRILYSDKLGSADKGDKTEWLEYFSDGVKYSLQSALGRAKQAIDKLGVEARPTAREKEVLKLFEEMKEMTSADIAKNLNVSRQQAHNLLSSLVEKGFLGAKGMTKSRFYFLK